MPSRRRLPGCVITGLRHVDRDDHTAVLRLLGDRHDLTALRTAGRLPVACAIPRAHRWRRTTADQCCSRAATSSSGSTSMISSLASVEGSRSNISMTSLVSTTSSLASSSALLARSPRQRHRYAELHGVGPVTAAVILGQVRDVQAAASERVRIRNYNGTAPIEALSAAIKRHRLNIRGNRALNHAIHMIAVTQVGHDAPSRVYYLRKRAEGKTPRKRSTPRSGASPTPCGASSNSTAEHRWARGDDRGDSGIRRGRLEP